jgi:hypothetical protein
VEEASASETSVTMAAPNALATQATIESNAQGGTESTCNNNNNAAAGSSEGDREKSLEFAEDLMEKGSKAIKDNDFSEAAECFSRALQIRFRFSFSSYADCLLRGLAECLFHLLNFWFPKSVSYQSTCLLALMSRVFAVYGTFLFDNCSFCVIGFWCVNFSNIA